MASAPTPVSIDLPHRYELMGPMYIGIIINWFLYGGLILQVYHYSQKYIHDRKLIKLTVYFVLLVDTIQTILSTHVSWQYLVTFWGNTSIILVAPPTGISLPILSGFVGMVVQFFYAWRIWSLKQNQKIFIGVAALIVALAILQCVTAWVSAFKFLTLKDISKLKQILNGFTLWLAACVACDVAIAGAMITILAGARRHTSYNASHSLINRLIAHTLQTGAITVVAASVEIALFVTYPADNKHETPAFILGKLYSNCLMSTLNARQGGFLSTANETGQNSHTSSHPVSGFRTARSDTIVNMETVQSVTHDDNKIEMKPYSSGKMTFAPPSMTESKA